MKIDYAFCKKYGNQICLLKDLGLCVGKVIEVLKKGQISLHVKVDDIVIAIDRGLAMKILVR
ncbi:MAG: FeoA family protein [Caldimicrobium sp.]